MAKFIFYQAPAFSRRFHGFIVQLLLIKGR